MVADTALGAARPADVVLSPDGSLIYVAGKDGYVRVYLAETGALIHEWDVGTKLGGIDLSPGGSFLIVTEAEPLSAEYGENGSWTANRFTVTNYKVDTATGQVTSYPLEVTGYEYVPFDVAIQPNGTVLVTHSVLPGWSAWANMRSLNLATGEYTTLNISVRHDSVMSPSDDSSRILLTEADISDAPLRMLENGAIVANHQLYQDNISGFNEGVQAYSDDGGFVAQHLEGTGIVIYNEALQLQIKLSTMSARWTQSAASGLAFDAAGDNLYILDNVSDTIVQISTATWTIVQEIPVGVNFASDGNYREGEYGNRLLVGPDARYFTVVTDTGLRLVVNPFVSDTITGTDAGETLTGTGLNDVLQGLDGDDVLVGGAGADAMTGGLGNDVYFVDNLDDTVTELAGEGTDEVRTNLGSKAPPERAVYVLPDFVENLTGTSAGAQGVRDNALDNVITMGNGHDLIVADAGGVDTLDGGAGNDFFYYGDKLTAADITNGGLGIDTIALLGDYGTGITFTATNLVGVERMALYTSLYLPGTGPNNYSITMNDANVAAGTEFFVTAASLQSNESLTFNGAAESDGRFTVHGGGGADTIVGGAGGDFIIGNAGNDSLYGLGGVDFLVGGLGADQLRGGAGSDRFVYQSTAQSTTGSVDHILDFQHVDRIDLSAIDANGNAGDGNTAFTFIGANAFGNVAGELRAWQNGADWFVEGDTNGDGLADLTIQVTLPDATPLAVGDFIL
jgi:Ca2+-binding RTX toxin-like protein